MQTDSDNQTGTKPKGGIGVVQIDLRAMKYRTLLGLLFMHPKFALALLCVRPFVFKSVMTMLALCTLGGLALASCCRSWNAADIRKGLEFFHATVGDTRIVEGRLAWDETAAQRLPASHDIGRFRLTVAGKADTLSERTQAIGSAGSGIEMSGNGLLVSPTSLWSWSRGRAGEEIIWQELPLLSRLKGADGTGEFCLDAESVESYAVVFACGIFIAQWLMESVSLITEWLAWCGMLVVLSLFSGVAAMVFRQPAMRIPFLHRLRLAISLSANLTLVPMLAALIYAVAGLGSPSSMVSIMFLIYLVYAAIEGRNGRLGLMVPPNGK